MKRLILMTSILLALTLTLYSNASAVLVNFDTYGLHGWGRLYEVLPGGPPIGTASTGLDALNPGYSFDNTYNPGVNNPPQNMIPINTYRGRDLPFPPGKEDSWGIIGVNRLTDSLTNTIAAPAAGKKWAIFFWGGDDVAMSWVANPAGGIPFSTIYSLGFNAELWETPAGVGQTYVDAVKQGTLGRSNPVDPSFYNLITDGGGTRLLTVVGHTKILWFDSDLDGIMDPGEFGLYDAAASLNTLLGPPPFGFQNTTQFDILPGDLWSALFDSNTMPDGQGGFADMNFNGQFFDNRPFYGGPGDGHTAPNINDMWTVYNQPSVQADMIPEPTTMLLLGSGLIGLAGFARRRFKK